MLARPYYVLINARLALTGEGRASVMRADKQQYSVL